MNLEDRNYYSDHRVIAGMKKKGAPTVWRETDEGEPYEEALPTKYAVCGTCEGRGSHVNPSIDACGLTAEDFAADPDFAEDYRRGVYDIPCNSCDGQRVILVVDEDACTPELLAEYQEERREAAADRAERLAELRAGC